MALVVPSLTCFRDCNPTVQSLSMQELADVVRVALSCPAPLRMALRFATRQSVVDIFRLVDDEDRFMAAWSYMAGNPAAAQYM
jgi:hypothetical protein